MTVQAWRRDLERTLIPPHRIAARVRELAGEIGRDFEGATPLLIGTLTGAAVFLSDLIRSLPIPHEVDFVAVSSYGAQTTSAGRLEWIKEPSVSVKGRDLVIVEDIVDTGLTLQRLVERLKERGAARVGACVLLDKRTRRTVPVHADSLYVGFVVPDEFLVGYGLDYAGAYRGLPQVAVLRRSVYESD